MAATYVIERQAHTREIAFAGDGVRLAGQIDYPQSPRPERGYPLIFLLHDVSWNTRDEARHYARTALNVGFAVFRWDRRGTGRSGAGGYGSTTQDAVNAYETALEQPDVNPRRAVILAHGASTLMLGENYGLFARVQPPAGVLLGGNMLDEDGITAITAPIAILQGSSDWHDPERYARAVAAQHNRVYRYGATAYVAQDADRMLMVGDGEHSTFHFGAVHVMQDWLNNL